MWVYFNLNNNVMKYYLLFLVTILVTSCHSHSNQSNISLKDLHNSNQKFDIENLFEFSYIPLEYNSNCPIINIDKAIVTDGTIFIKSDNSIYRFSLTGDFISQIGTFGQGPGEYLSVMDIAINETSKNVYVVDINQKKILIYNYDSNYIGDIPLERWISHIESADNQILLSTMNTTGVEIDKLIACDSNGKELARFNNDVKYELQDFYMYPEVKTIQTLNNDIIFRQPFNDTIYTYNPQKQLLEKRYVFNFGSLHMPYDILAGYDQFTSQSNNYCFIDDITESNDFIFVDLSNCGNSEKYVINKSEVITYRVDNNNAGLFIKESGHYFWPLWLYSGTLISFLNADELIERSNQVKNPVLTKIISSLNEESNPILVICKRK